MPELALQFPIEEVAAYAARFPAVGDEPALAIGRAARERGHYTRAEFVAACRWKTPRSAPLVALNSAEAVEAATRLALDPATGERERMAALRSLSGVSWATASVLLHLADPDRWPILDVRAVQALGASRPGAGLGFWEAYVQAYRDVAARAGVDGRTLDRALWQWSKERDAVRRPSARA
jgi:hypothetical protein